MEGSDVGAAVGVFEVPTDMPCYEVATTASGGRSPCQSVCYLISLIQLSCHLSFTVHVFIVYALISLLLTNDHCLKLYVYWMEGAEEHDRACDTCASCVSCVTVEYTGTPGILPLHVTRI